jgi:hypothetical protein
LDQHHDALLDRAVADLPVHLQFFGDRAEALAELGEVEGQRIGLDLDAHEVAPVRRSSAWKLDSRIQPLCSAMKPATRAMMPTWSGQEADSV